jgi:hypothetical protein
MADNDRLRIIITLIAALIISFIVNVILLYAFVEPYLGETNRVVSIFDLYRNLETASQENIFFIGSSQIQAGVDCNVIEEHLRKSKRHSSRAQIYNLGYPGDTPLRRLTEVARLSECHPRMVFIGLTYYALNDTSFPISADDLALVSRDIQLDNYSRSLFSEGDIGLIDMNPLYSKFYHRRFIIPSLLNIFRKKETPEYEAAMNFKALPMSNENLTHELLLIRLNNSRDTLDKYVVGIKENVQKEALNHTLHLLDSHGISVVIINMPLNPVLSEQISKDTRNNYFSFLNSTGSTYYDYESNYPSQCFNDLTHLNFRGRKQFSDDMATIISNGIDI